MSIVFPQVPLDEWCKTHKLTPATRKCVKCGAEQTTTIPWATKEWRGLHAELHECGKQYQLTVAVDVDPKARAEWVELVNSMKNGVFD